MTPETPLTPTLTTRFASLATTGAAESIGRDIYCILPINMTAHQFHPVRRLFCAWHWFPMSASMSVYLRNRAKWPPITRPIDLRWWWKPVDKTSLPTHYAGAFVSSEKIIAPAQTALFDVRGRRGWGRRMHSRWMPKYRLVFVQKDAGERSAEMIQGDAEIAANF